MNATAQLGLFDPRTKLDRAFEAFHRANPEVYATLVRLARRALENGHRRIGIRMLWERMRWELTVEVRRREGEFELNNNLTSRYARRIAQLEPDLREVFELRELRS